MFGLFQKRPVSIGNFSLNVYRNSGVDVSVEYSGEQLGKGESLFLRALYAAKTMYTASNAELSAYVLAAIKEGCLYFDNGEGTDIASVLNVNLVPQGRALVERYTSYGIQVIRNPKLDLPVIQTDTPSEATYADLYVTIAAFNESWLHEYSVTPGTFAAKSFLQFFAGFVSYYDHDQTAYTDPQSIIQAPMKAYFFANANAMGLAGLIEE